MIMFVDRDKKFNLFFIYIYLKKKREMEHDRLARLKGKENKDEIRFRV